MKFKILACALILSGCSALPLVQTSPGAESCGACDAHFDQCKKAFANFPERGAVECPTEQNRCLKACAGAPKTAPVAVTAQPLSAAPVEKPESKTGPTASKEAKLRELKHYYEEGLISEDVYRARQTVILSEP